MSLKNGKDVFAFFLLLVIELSHRPISVVVLLKSHLKSRIGRIRRKIAFHSLCFIGLAHMKAITADVGTCSNPLALGGRDRS